MTPGYRPPLTPWEATEYRGEVWRMATSAVVCGLLLIALLSLI